jgi:hypothetical protein
MAFGRLTRQLHRFHRGVNFKGSAKRSSIRFMGNERSGTLGESSSDHGLDSVGWISFR